MFLISILLLCISNIFMLFAWYSHLKELSHSSWFIIILVSWLIAFIEYSFLIPGIRIGSSLFTIGQLKIIQEVISLSIFIPFSIYYLKEPITTDYLIACIFLLIAIFFIFRTKIFV